MATQSELNLRPIRHSEMLFAAGSFASGVASTVAALSLVTFENPSLFLMYAALLAISPLVYVQGFLCQEAALPPRLRCVQVVAALAAGVAYVLVLWGAMAIGGLVESIVELPNWLKGGVLIVLWLLGPLAIAIISIPVERRLTRRTSIGVDDAR